MSADGWVLAWRISHIVLSAVGLTLMILDVRRRRHWTLQGRFYWQSLALLLGGIAFGATAALVEHLRVDPVRGVLTSLALIYFVISLALVDRRPGRQDQR